MAHQAFAVIDLGFGDSGKGTIVDYLVRKTGSNLVVRFNGGAQAGHNVVTPDGVHHCFSQFGSGTFVEGVRTLLTSDVAIHPIALEKEATRLQEIGIWDALSRLYIERDCLVITPYHQALNCLKELSRGAEAHGSCGVGHGEAVSMSINCPDTALRAWHLSDHRTVADQLHKIREMALAEAARLTVCPTLAWNLLGENDLWCEWHSLLHDEANVEVIARMFFEFSKRLTIVSEGNNIIQLANVPIFEGAQGVLIDDKWGFAPYHTWSDTTGAQIHKRFGLHPGNGSITPIGVVRAFPTRHGAGPFPTRQPDLEANTAFLDEHNSYNKWQGRPRIGSFDHVLTRYAMQACKVNNFPISGLAVTHLDQVKLVDDWQSCTMYDIDGPIPGVDAEALMWATAKDRTKLISGVTPFYEDAPPNEQAVYRSIESYAERPVLIKSFGPTANEKVSIL